MDEGSNDEWNDAGKSYLSSEVMYGVTRNFDAELQYTTE